MKKIFRKLAFHYSKSEDPQKGSYYLEKVGDINSKYFSYIQSVENYQESINFLERERLLKR